MWEERARLVADGLRVCGHDGGGERREVVGEERAIEARPISLPPPVFSAKNHLNYQNFINTDFQYWSISQGLTDATSVRHLPMTFSNPILRSHIHSLVTANPNEQLPAMVTRIIRETAMQSESTSTRRN